MNRWWEDRRDIDFDEERWHRWGIEGLDPVSTNLSTYGELNDISNYWDQPRELAFSVRVKW